MKSLVVAAVIGIVAVSPAIAQQADGGRAYSGKSVQTNSGQPSPSSSSSSVPTSTQPTPATNPVGAAAKAGKEVLSIFGR